jgi:hypothetical protein
LALDERTRTRGEGRTVVEVVLFAWVVVVVVVAVVVVVVVVVVDEVVVVEDAGVRGKNGRTGVPPPATDKVKVWLAETGGTDESVMVMFTLKAPASVGEPVTAPVVASSDKP